MGLEGENAVKLFSLGEEDAISGVLKSTHYYENVVTVNNKKIYVRVRALYNSIVKGYAFYPASYDLMQDLEKLVSMGVINNE